MRKAGTRTAARYGWPSKLSPTSFVLMNLKQLRMLKWHRLFDPNGPWTRAGGVEPSDWPTWMRNFRDY